MASKTSRRRRSARTRRPQLDAMDPHVEVALSSALDTATLLSEVVQLSDPAGEVERRIDEAATQFVEGLAGYESLGTLEAIRMMTLPFVPVGSVMPSAGAQSGPAVAEILTAALLCAASDVEGREVTKRVDQVLCGVISETLMPLAHELLNLATVRDLVGAEALDDLAQVSAAVRGNGRWMRNTSYPDMQEEVLQGLFGEPAVDAGVREILGFGVQEAVSFLTACHDLQMEQFNVRSQGLANAFNSIDMRQEHRPTDEEKQRAIRGLMGLFNPSAQQAAVPTAAVAARAGMSVKVAQMVVQFFTATIPDTDAGDVLRCYLDGNSPLRAHPILSRDGLVMVVHPALIADAVKSGLEDALKSSAFWDLYTAHRGHYLESRIADLFGRLVPGISAHHGVEYLVPANEAEANGGSASYTKLVEGDHLFVLHDVAFIVEDKAVPLSDRSRTGELNPLRRNLTSAITKGADQAARMKRRILDDHGLRLRDGTWLDLADVREVHTVVTSLDDMPGIATATAKLVGAGLISTDNIPWTVSLNDLELISKLVDRPAEFLLYVRRRTDPRATEMFVAVDELDLFLLFFRMGLYVEPDPAVAAREMPWLGQPRPADLRRFKNQVPTLVTSHTDHLDAWYHSQRPGSRRGTVDAVSKPCMVPSPLAPLIDWLEDNRTFCWLSIGATLLEGSSKAQQQLANYPVTLLKRPDPNGKPRSAAIPWGLTQAESWLLVWMTRPKTMDGERVTRHAHAYMVAKKHQLRVRRGASFVYDEATGALVGASYDSGQTEVEPDVLAELVASLRPAGEMQTQAQLTQRRRGARSSSKKRKRKNRR